MAAQPEAVYKSKKDPEAKLDYGFDLTSWVPDDNVIQTATWTVPAGLTKVSEGVVEDTIAVVRLSGGTAGTEYPCVCHFTASPSGDEDDRTLWIECKDR